MAKQGSERTRASVRNSVAERAVEAVNQYKFATPKTSIVYHYTDVNGLMGILKPDGATLWFSHSDYLNDISEGRDVLKHFHIVCEEMMKGSPNNKEMLSVLMQCSPDNRTAFVFRQKSGNTSGAAGALLDGTSKMEIDDPKFDTYVCCFSMHDNLLPMWNQYNGANPSYGYCISFYVDMFEKNERTLYVNNSKEMTGYNMRIKQVIYSNVEKQKILREFLSDIIEMWENEPDPVDVLCSMVQIMLRNLRFVFKNELFSHENECRVILEVSRNIANDSLWKPYMPEVKFRTRKDLIVPYIEVCFSQSHPVVTSVIIGPLAQNDAADTALRKYLDTRQYNDRVIKHFDAPLRY